MSRGDVPPERIDPTDSVIAFGIHLSKGNRCSERSPNCSTETTDGSESADDSSPQTKIARGREQVPASSRRLNAGSTSATRSTSLPRREGGGRKQDDTQQNGRRSRSSSAKSKKRLSRSCKKSGSSSKDQTRSKERSSGAQKAPTVPPWFKGLPLARKPRGDTGVESTRKGPRYLRSIKSVTNRGESRTKSNAMEVFREASCPDFGREDAKPAVPRRGRKFARSLSSVSDNNIGNEALERSLPSKRKTAAALRKEAGLSNVNISSLKSAMEKDGCKPPPPPPQTAASPFQQSARNICDNFAKIMNDFPEDKSGKRFSIGWNSSSREERTSDADHNVQEKEGLRSVKEDRSNLPMESDTGW